MARKRKNSLFIEYYKEWVKTYKENSITKTTMDKYRATGMFIERNFSDLFIDDLSRREYQQILNLYAETHERQTTMDFHHQVKGCIQDLFHDGMIERDPTFKAIIKGKEPSIKKPKFMQVEALKKLIKTLDVGTEVNKDWLILLIAKTGLRYAEALGITPNDFNFKDGTLTINKTWGYKNKENPTFAKTKNMSSVRTIDVDWQIIGQFAPIIKDLPADEPIFVEKDKNGSYKRIFNSTDNCFLERKCKQANIEIVTIHSLRHTHASVLLSAGVSIHSISRRLGHSSVGTTQEVYAHILEELQTKDKQIMMQALMSAT